jgi:predicted ATP-binding protein involved in virulence
MYIRSIKIKNIRSIKDFDLNFSPDNCAGWHVIIGDNGSGKSTVAKSIALGLIGVPEALGLREDWNNWLRQKCKRGQVKMTLLHKNVSGKYISGVVLEKTNSTVKPFNMRRDTSSDLSDPTESLSDVARIFSASYGPFRRFSGGSKGAEKLKTSYPRLIPHLSLFGEDFALTECLEWIEDLRFKQLEEKEEGNVLPLLKQFINKGELLPGGAVFQEVSSDGVVFKDPNGSNLAINELSDGYRSILSLTFDLIRQMVSFFGYKDVFRNIPKKGMTIDLPGVVIIDEIDAHLHPSWQKRIGYWLTQYFPKIQFIVTTHSPLVCHAAERGSVWRLASPGSDQTSGKVEGTDRQRLLFGNIVEAMDTELFGKDVIRSESSQKKLRRLEKLNMLSLEGEITNVQEKELQHLRAAMPTSINAGIKKGGAR